MIKHTTSFTDTKIIPTTRAVKMSLFYLLITRNAKKKKLATKMNYVHILTHKQLFQTHSFIFYDWSNFWTHCTNIIKNARFKTLAETSVSKLCITSIIRERVHLHLWNTKQFCTLQKHLYNFSMKYDTSWTGNSVSSFYNIPFNVLSPEELEQHFIPIFESVKYKMVALWYFLTLKKTFQ